jgi:hypothetical protein
LLLEQLVDPAQLLLRVSQGQQLVAGIRPEAEVGDDEIGQAVRGGGAFQDDLGILGVHAVQHEPLDPAGPHSIHQQQHAPVQDLGIRFVIGLQRHHIERLGLHEAPDAGFAGSLHQDLEPPVRQLGMLQQQRNAAQGMDPVLGGEARLFVMTQGQKQVTAVLERRFHGLQLVAFAYEQRQDHSRRQEQMAQG